MPAINYKTSESSAHTYLVHKVAQRAAGRLCAQQGVSAAHAWVGAPRGGEGKDAANQSRFPGKRPFISLYIGRYRCIYQSERGCSGAHWSLKMTTCGLANWLWVPGMTYKHGRPWDCFLLLTHLRPSHAPDAHHCRVVEQLLLLRLYL
eukprot:scaffold50906_cov18-Tisochrysis_lutea.AAC.1